MELQTLPERLMHWNTSDDGLFKGVDYERIMTRTTFESIYYLQLSRSGDNNSKF